MADELKPISMRLNDNDIQIFRKFADDNDLTQGDAFNTLIALAEIEKARNQLGDRAKEIDVFKNTVNKLLSFYINSLEVNQATENRIREELSKELKSKDEVIRDLQHNFEKAKEDSIDYNNQFLSEVNLKIELEEKLNAANKDISDKNYQLVISNRNNNTLQDQLTEYKQYKEDYKILEKSVDKLNTDIELLQKDNNKLSNDNELLNNKVKSDMDMITFYKGELEKKDDSIKEHKADFKALTDKNNIEIVDIKAEHNKEIVNIKADYNKEVANVKAEHNKALEKQLKALEVQYNNRLDMEVAKKNLEIEILKNSTKIK